jgi:tRNA pseudouridine55 synthase
VDKPAGITSHDVVARVRRTLRIRPVGHSGTLDPFATGLVIVVAGKATRLVRFLDPLRKSYRATARLGVRTDTEDATGRVVGRVETAAWPGLQEVEAAIAGLTGTIEQVPPAFSAKRVGGRRSHDLARRGQAVELRPVTVVVDRLAVLRYEPPDLEFEAQVASGTYIRSLARDLGELLGVGAHLTALRREAIGSFRVADAVPLDAVGPATALLSPSALLKHIPAVEVDAAEAEDVAHGRAVRRPGASGVARLERGGSLLAVGEGRVEGWQPIVVLEGR